MRLSLTTVGLAAVVLIGPLLLVATHAQAPDGRGGTSSEDDDRALAEFKRNYALAPGEDLKCVAPPRPDGVRVYWRREYPNHGNRPDQFGSLIFRWGNRLVWGGGTTARGYTLTSLPSAIGMSFHPVEVDGDRRLLDTIVDGDFIFRGGVPDERMAAQLETVLRRDAKLPVRLAIRQVERDVVVAMGKYQYHPLPGRSNNQVEIYGREYVEHSGAGGGSGDFATFLKWVAGWIERPVVAGEVEGAPAGQMSWNYHARSPSTAVMRLEDHDEVAVLQHMTEQTGLTFERQRVPVRTLIVERAE
jgi:hypothetical protein